MPRRPGHRRTLAFVASANTVEPSNSSSPASEGRPLRAAVGLAPERITELLAQALEGRGPALMPVPAGTPDARVAELLAAMRPESVLGPEGLTTLDDGVPTREDTALVVTTSGSTGSPKGVELSASALHASARSSVERIGARPGDAWLCVLPAGHISGLQVITRALVTDTEPVHAVFDVEDVTELARKLGPHVSLVPTQLRRLLATGTDLSLFGTILLGGAAADPSLLEAARRAGGRVLTTYGMSETCGGCVYDGVPLDCANVRVDSDSSGEPGRILLSGTMLMSGYRHSPGERRTTTPWMVDGSGRQWLRTNDLGRLDGGRLTVLGRQDDVINTGGHKVVPAQVNDLLLADPAVAEAVVVGRPDPEWGQRVTAVVVPADPAAPPSLESLRDRVREQLPSYAAPRELEIRSALPMLSSGKPDLAALRRH